MPPPPSQKGVFKPRKPKKIVRPGESSAVADGASGGIGSASSSSATVVAFDPTTSGGGQGGRGDVAANRYVNRSNNNNTGGRGGRGGRGGGRGRSPAPQGRVFFTGGERKPGTNSPSSGSSSKRKSSGKSVEGEKSGPRGDTGEGTENIRDVADSTEEVVGQLETAIGGHHGKSKNDGNRKTGGILSGGSDKMDYHEDDQEGAVGPRGTTDIGLPGCMYDSDSSDEGSLTRKGHQTGFMAPLELPFPTNNTLPERTASSKLPQRIGEGRIMNDSHTKPSWTSPFGNVRQGKIAFEETNSWFLVQLPTRLPPLKQKNPPPANSTSTRDGDNDGLDAMVADSVPSSNAVAPSNFSEVITPPVVTSEFDNSLEGVAPGQIGRILVYKSGKTVLVMDGPDGRQLRMEVNEGFTCSFLQEAVAIDFEEGNYVPLGDVKKSIVVSPDLSSIVGD